jgi:hypothetical protein
MTLEELKQIQEKRRALVQETRDFYYGPWFEPLPTRAMQEDIINGVSGGMICVYKTEGGDCCAVGRLGPDEPWTVGSVANRHNAAIALRIAHNRGLLLEDEETINFFQRLQHLHDKPNKARKHFDSLMARPINVNCIKGDLKELLCQL